jgi:hypothetical protein
MTWRRWLIGIAALLLTLHVIHAVADAARRAAPAPARALDAFATQVSPR